MKNNKKLVACLLACALMTVPLAACSRNGHYTDKPDSDIGWIEDDDQKDPPVSGDTDAVAIVIPRRAVNVLGAEDFEPLFDHSFNIVVYFRQVESCQCSVRRIRAYVSRAVDALGLLHKRTQDNRLKFSPPPSTRCQPQQNTVGANCVL